jgi:trans-aconitate 2-methyltransferase
MPSRIHQGLIAGTHWPTAAVYGVDNSKEMLSQAAATPGTIQWLEADIRTWWPDHAPDLLYSNATLHWVEGHRELFPRLIGCLKSGGCLAVQMPFVWREPSHRLMRETLANGGPDGGSLGTEELRQAVDRAWVEDAEGTTPCSNG